MKSESGQHPESLHQQYETCTVDVIAFLEQHASAPHEAKFLVLCHDLGRRLRSDSNFRVEYYLERLPFLTESTSVKLDLIRTEFLALRELGATPRIEEYCERFPDLREELSDLHSEEQEIDSQRVDAEFISTIISPARPDADSSPSQPDSTWEPKVRHDSVSRFGDYEILKEIARGGMGVVFEARQLSLNRRVALKMIKSSQLAGEEDLRRFQTEAESVAKLDHPGIVPIYEVGEIEGQHFFSMGLIRGGSLIEVVKNKSPDPKSAARLMLKVAEAIQFAHSQGIIHRDLKPGNILLDSQGNPKVADFGLAKHLDEESDLTESGQIMGTPAYMPPEQARGEFESIGPASDQYSLGVMLYELCTGMRPFSGAAHVVIPKILSEDPPSLRSLNPKAPRDLEAICHRAMQKSPQHRYPSVEEFANDLNRFLNDEPVRTRKYGLRERTARLMRRRKFTLFTTVSICLAVVLTWYFTPEPPQKPLPKLITVDDMMDYNQAIIDTRQDLSSISVSFQNYHDVHRKFPPWAIYSQNGSPLLSWRVAILPYIDQRALYEKFHLDEPWDSPHNLKLLDLMPGDFANDLLDPENRSHTHYRAVIGSGTCFEPFPDAKVRRQDIKDNQSNTLLVVDSQEMVPWTKPDEIPLPPETSWPHYEDVEVHNQKVLNNIGGNFEEGFFAIAASGETKFYLQKIFEQEDVVRSLFTRNDGQIHNLTPFERFPRLENVIEDKERSQQLMDENAKRTELNQKLALRNSEIRESQNRLRSIYRAFQKYESSNKRLPARAISNKEGQPLLSWRVSLLPLLGEKALYEKFHLDEPWDSPHNFSLLPLMPQAFRVMGRQPRDAQTTYFQVFVGDNTPFPLSLNQNVTMEQIETADGKSKTLMLGEAAQPVPWTKPQDIHVTDDLDQPVVGGLFDEGFQGVLCDGTVIGLSPSSIGDRELLKSLSGFRDRTLIEPRILKFDLAADIVKEMEKLSPKIGGVRGAFLGAYRTWNQNNMKGLVIAFRNYEQAHKALPLTSIRDSERTPLLSWRV